jgi:2-polyprenyl-3-methyl-5-hydroxy-6-metoxy-1,4-benzoquinol methylase
MVVAPIFRPRIGLLAGMLAVAFVACRAPAAPASPPDRAAVPTPSPATTPDRDRYRRPDLLVAALPIAEGAAIADVGAGDGYLTHRLAARAGSRGRVTATDVDAAALARIGASRPGEAPIVTRGVTPDDPGLEAATYDLILLSEVDHLLPDPAGYLRRLIPALRPGGRIAVSNRRAQRAALLAAATRAGLSVCNEYGGLPTHFLIEIKP